MKIYYTLLSILFHVLFLPINAVGGIDERLLIQKLNPNDQGFLEFPFATYARAVGIDDIKKLEYDRQLLNKMDYDGDRFMEKYLEYYFNQDPLGIDQPEKISSMLRLGERFNLAGQIMGDTTLLYEKLSDEIFSKVSSIIQEGIDTGVIESVASEAIYWIHVLAGYQYFLNLPSSDIEKGVRQLENENYAYLLKRVWSDYKGQVIFCLGCCLVLNYLLYIWICNWRARNKPPRTRVRLRKL